MCSDIKFVYYCNGCEKLIGENLGQEWCRDAKRKEEYGRCPGGVQQESVDFHHWDCDACEAVREQQMDKLDMADFTQRRLGWRGVGSTPADPSESDGEEAEYSW